jgi:phage/plasmid-like protein (TIGR03299 family)
MVKQHIFGNFHSVEGSMTAEEAMEVAKLDYEVKKSPVTFPIIRTGISDSGDFIDVTTQNQLEKRFVTYRTDTDVGFDVVSDNYNIVQNKDAFSFFDNLSEKGGIIYKNAGYVGKGEKVFLQAKLPEDVTILNEEYENYLTLVLSHDGKASIKCFFTPTRIWCNNTLISSFKESNNKVTIRHSSNALERLNSSSEILGISKKYFQDTKEFLERSSKINLNTEDFKNNFKTIFLDDKEIKELTDSKLSFADGVKKGVISTRKLNVMQEAYRYTMGHETQQSEACKGTAYGLLQGVTGYFQNVKSFRDEKVKFESIMEGTSQKIVQRSVKLIETLL